MRVKQHLHISDPMEFARGIYTDCFAVCGHDYEIGDWICVGEIEIDVDVDRQECVNASLKKIDEERKKLQQETQAKMQLLDDAEKNLLCLENMSDE